MQEITTFFANHQALAITGAILFVFLMVVEYLRLKQKTASIGPLEATRLINHDNAVVIDLRSADLYRKGHIIDAISIPANELKSQSKKLEKYRSKPIIIVCNAGIESQKIATLLNKEGYNAVSLSGGMRSWIDAQMPLIKE